jgi:hypothetical protein
VSDLKQDIEALLEQLIERWDGMRLAEIRDLWDPDEAQPFYLPEEAEEPLTSWADIEAYWQRTRDTIARLSMRIWEVNAKPLGPDLAVALYRMHWNADVTGFPKAVGGDNRVTAIFRHTAEGWRFCHYVEAPLAPIVYMRQLYELNVDDSFKDG